MSIYKKINTPLIYRVILIVCFMASATMMAVSFVLPPQGVIDSSVLQACGIIFLYPVISLIPVLINTDKDVEVHTKNGTEIKISDEKTT